MASYKRIGVPRNICPLYKNSIKLIDRPTEAKMTRAGSTMSSKSESSSNSYCVNLVRNHDHENFLCCLLLPNSVRTAAFAVRGFNVEVSKVQDQVSEPKIAQMRFQFWTDTLDKLYNKNVPEHPVAQELFMAIQKHELKKQHLKSLVSARSSQLSAAGFSTLESVESYAEASVSSVYYLLFQAAGIASVHADHAASHLGKAQGITNLLRALPHHCARRSVPLPQSVLLKHGVAQERVLRGSREQAVRDVIFDVATRAKQHLDKARSMKDKVPKEAYPLLLPAAPASWFLEKLQELDFDVFHPKLQRRNHWLPFTLYVNKLLKRY